jgi:hypothetical protein
MCLYISIYIYITGPSHSLDHVPVLFDNAVGRAAAGTPEEVVVAAMVIPQEPILALQQGSSVARMPALLPLAVKPEIG